VARPRIHEGRRPLSDVLAIVPMRPANTNTAPHFAVPSGACDAHVHVFEPGYPHVPHPHYEFPDASLRQLRALTAFLGVDRVVIVQPSYYGTDNRVLLGALAQLGAAARGVVIVDEHVSDAELDRFGTCGVRAIRLDLFARAAWPRSELRAYITRMFERVRPRGWHLQFYTPGYVVRDLLPFLTTIESDFVIDHMGYMLEADGLGPGDFASLLELMKLGHAWLKLSGPYRLAKGKGYGAVAHLARAIAAARPDRALWGSDWPHLPDGSRDTGELLNLVLDWIPDPATRNRILVENPARLFSFA
jgi:2-pyrone-4,6-dicarboxylate lactonase